MRTQPIENYLVKAKRIDNKEWIEGFFFCRNHTDARYTHSFLIPLGISLEKGTRIEDIQVEVDPDTLCRCIGLQDKNQTFIWENDIVKKESYTDYEYFARSKGYIGIVKYEDCEWGISHKRENYSCFSPIHMAIEYHEAEHFEVLGNIFDNPELLQQKERKEQQKEPEEESELEI